MYRFIPALFTIALFAMAFAACESNTPEPDPAVASGEESSPGSLSTTSSASSTGSGDGGSDDGDREVAKTTRAGSASSTVAQATATAVPEPADAGPWMTALEAIAIADAQTAGKTLVEAAAHVSRAAGGTVPGDSGGAAAGAPEAGNSTEWWVYYQEGDLRTYCEVTIAGVTCNDFSHPALGTSVAGAGVDSDEAVNAWVDSPEWATITKAESYSVLLSLKSDIAGEGHTLWTANLTVHWSPRPDGVSSGNFVWNMTTGAKTVSIF